MECENIVVNGDDTEDAYMYSDDDSDDSVEIIDEVHQTDHTKNAETWKEEGNQLYKNQDYSGALKCYTEAIELCPTCAAYYGNRSACYMMLRMFGKAMDDAKESIRLDTAFVKGYIRGAKCALAMGNLVEGEGMLNKAVEIDPCNPSISVESNNLKTVTKFQEEADKSYKKSDFRKVVYCMDRALELAVAAVHYKVLKAECLALLGRYSESQDIANELLLSNNMNADAIYVRGMCLYYEDKVDKAFQHFQQVLRLAPDHQKAKDIYRKAKQLKTKKEEGNDLFKGGKFAEAYDVYTEALAIDPQNKFTNAKLFLNRAIVCSKTNRLSEAVDDCTKAIELDEKYLKAFLRRAKCHMELEQFEEAVRDYEAAFKMDKSRENKRLLQDAKLELKKSKRKDYYKILGIDKNASDDEIKKAYRKRALIHHPDRHSSASESEKKEQEKKFKEIGEAYSILSDQKKRRCYDQGQDLEDMDSFTGDIDPNNIFQAFFGGPGGTQFNFSSSGFPGGFSFQFS